MNCVEYKLKLDEDEQYYLFASLIRKKRIIYDEIDIMDMEDIDYDKNFQEKLNEMRLLEKIIRLVDDRDTLEFSGKVIKLNNEIKEYLFKHLFKELNKPEHNTGYIDTINSLLNMIKLDKMASV